jgi:hypothetical protein
MKLVTVTKIHFGPYIKWTVIVYFIFGVLTGLAQAILGYLSSGENLTSYLSWYGVGLPLLYLTVGLVGGSLFAFIYNSFSRSLGGYVIEVNDLAINEQGPPPPPDDFGG